MWLTSCTRCFSSSHVGEGVAEGALWELWAALPSCVAGTLAAGGPHGRELPWTFRGHIPGLRTTEVLSPDCASIDPRASLSRGWALSPRGR